MENAQPTDQAKPQSMEDRIASQFGIGDDPEPEAYQEAPPPETGEEQEGVAPESDDAEVEYEGAKYRVPKPLEKAILQERDYTQKTQKLAEERRQLDYAQKSLETARIKREFDESVGPDLNRLQQMDDYLDHMTKVNLEGMASEELVKHSITLNQVERQRNALQKSIDAKRGEYGHRAQEAIQNLKSMAHDVLAKSIAGFTPETVTELRNHAKTLGYTEADFDMIELDPRASTMLYKAMAYDRLQASKDAAVLKASSAPPGVKPGASNAMPQAVRDKLGFQKAMKTAKSSQDKAKLIEQEMMRRF